MFRNGDPYYNARRIVINQKRVCNFETLLREVTGGIQAPFGAVRNIYTPRGGHKVDCMESLQSGEHYLQIGSRKKRMLQTLPVQARPLPQHRIVVSARFLKPIKEPCPIFVVANGDVLNPAMRLLIHQRILGQFDKILEMITEKMGLRVLGGVRSLYTYEGHQVTDGNLLESGQLYVAVGRERFKKLPYSDLLFTKPRGTRRVNGMKAYSLPPIYRFSKQNGNSKSMVRSSDSGDGESKGSPPVHSGSNKEHLSSIVREISQARLISLRKKRSGQSMTLATSDNDELESKADDRNAEGKSSQDEPTEEKPAAVDTKASEENGEKAEEKEETYAENTTEEETSASKQEPKENEETSEKDEQDKTVEKGTQDEDSGKEGESSKDPVNDVDRGEEQKEKENSNDAVKTQSDNETKENNNGRSSSRNSNQEANVSKTKEDATKESGEEERQVNGEVSSEDDQVESEAEQEVEEKNSASRKDATANGKKGEDNDSENQDKSRKVKD
eukprot:superscaffoldBa00000341_g3933